MIRKYRDAAKLIMPAEWIAGARVEVDRECAQLTWTRTEGTTDWQSGDETDGEVLGHRDQDSHYSGVDDQVVVRSILVDVVCHLHGRTLPAPVDQSESNFRIKATRAQVRVETRSVIGIRNETDPSFLDDRHLGHPSPLWVRPRVARAFPEEQEAAGRRRSRGVAVGACTEARITVAGVPRCTGTCSHG